VGIFLRLTISLTSRAKGLITDRRNRLSAEIIEASECFNSWIKADLLLGVMSGDIPLEEGELNEQNDADLME
jgi:hypothetical protein